MQAAALGSGCKDKSADETRQWRIVMSTLQQEDNLKNSMAYKRSLPALNKGGKNQRERKAFLLDSICSCFDSFHGLKDNYLAFIPKDSP